MPENRPAVHAYLSSVAHAAWHTWAEQNGVSVTAAIEAIGIELRDLGLEAARKALAEEGNLTPTSDAINARLSSEGDAYEGVRRDLVRAARRVDAARRRRGN
jgi:hypothetical protein